MGEGSRSESKGRKDMLLARLRGISPLAGAFVLPYRTVLLPQVSPGNLVSQIRADMIDNPFGLSLLWGLESQQDRSPQGDI